MKEKIKTRWLNDLAFEAEVDGHKIYLDTSLEHGGKNTGPRPKPLMMIALAGCTGMDVAAMLKKMRVARKKISGNAVWLIRFFYNILWSAKV